MEKQELDKCEQILKDPQLFEKINQEFDKKIVGEQDTRQTVFLISCGGKLVKNRKTTSGNLLVSSESGSGKDFVIKNVLNILPDQDVIKRKRISPTVLDHSELDWTGKILYVEDIQNSVLNSSVMKVTCSNDDLESFSSIVNKQNKVEEKKQKGIPVIIFSSSWSYLKNEMLRRFPIIKLNETEPQTREIVKRKLEEEKNGKLEDYDPDIKQSLTLLERVNVKIPFTDKLKDILPTENIITRTQLPRFLDYIKFSTGIHQFQRKKEDDYLLSEPQDYDIGRMCFMKTVSNEKTIPLTHNDEKTLKFFKENQDLRFSVDEVLGKININFSRPFLKTILDNLSKNGFLEQDQVKEEGKRTFTVYQFKEVKELYIPTWEELKNKEEQIREEINNKLSDYMDEKYGIEVMEKFNERNGYGYDPTTRRYKLKW